MAFAPAPAATPFWRSILHYDSAKVLPWIAFRNAMGVAIPLALGVWMGRPGSGLIATVGALNVAFSDGYDPYLHRLRRMLTASLCCGLAVFAGGLCGRHLPLAVLVTACFAFTAGMMVALGATATDIANVTLVTLIVFSSQSMTVSQAGSSGMAALGGGVLQTALALALWPFRRYGPERRALAELYLALAKFAGAAARVMEAPPATLESTQAQTALAALGHERTIEAERYLTLLSQAERIRLELLTLIRLRVRLSREDHTEEETAILDRCLALATSTLSAIGGSLLERSGTALPDDSCGSLAELRTLTESLRRPERSGNLSGMLRDARRQLDALAGQLRAACELASHTSPAGTMQFERREAAQPWALRISGTVAIVRANLNLQSAVFRHALRLMVCVTLGEVLAHIVPWPRPYWVPMTSAIVLRPDFLTTFNRGVLRVAGTLVGLGLSTLLFHTLTPSGSFEVLLIALFAFLLRCFGPANYGIFAANLSALVVMMFAATRVDPGQVIGARALSTIVGGFVALAAYGAWPTWERALVPEALARVLDAYRAYFQVLRDAFIEPGRSFAAELDSARQTARLARSNAEASVARLATEPGVPLERLAMINAVLANSHRFIHAVMSLEAGLVRSRGSERLSPARDAFRTFANHVDLTLYLLAHALRGSDISGVSLPDLREDHYALIHSGDPQVERYALTNVEADRIVNSLNTLAGEIERWRGMSSGRPPENAKPEPSPA